jgi:hypothetical protein
MPVASRTATESATIDWGFSCGASGRMNRAGRARRIVYGLLRAVPPPVLRALPATEYVPFGKPGSSGTRIVDVTGSNSAAIRSAPISIRAETGSIALPPLGCTENEISAGLESVSRDGEILAISGIPREK